MKLVTWNVNGLRACITKGFFEFFESVNADIFAVQETKLQPEQISIDPAGYEQYWNSAEKKGYSGTAVFTKNTPLSVSYGINKPVKGGYFAGYYNGKPNIAGRRLFIEALKHTMPNLY